MCCCYFPSQVNLITGDSLVIWSNELASWAAVRQYQNNKSRMSSAYSRAWNTTGTVVCPTATPQCSYVKVVTQTSRSGQVWLLTDEHNEESAITGPD